ncbi:MAG: hypothetical protein AB1489_36195, partial [Acidobacteriota bacterium]
MKKSRWTRNVQLCFLVLMLISSVILCPAQQYGDQPVARHISQDDIENGKISIAEVLKVGEALFNAEFNRLDGLNLRADKFNRVAGPETQSCADCHFRPFIGGAGPNVANVFAVPSDLNRIDATNPRNTNHMFGSGALERLGL